MMKLRTHQEAAKRIGQEIHAGIRNSKFLTALVTPGGGKTLMASLFAHELLRGDVDRVLIICPRVTLQRQMRDGFTVPALGLNGQVDVGHQSTMKLLNRGLDGCVTSYQDLLNSKSQKKWLQFVSEMPTLVVLDEAHHLQAADWFGPESAEETGWTASVAPLVDAAKRVLIMTGTMTRDSGARIAFVSYDPKTREPAIDIKYTRRDALDEQAITNVSVKICDGEARYWHRFGAQRHLLQNASGEEEKRSLRALIVDEAYRNSVIDEALKEFAQYRSMRNARARMIIVCANQEHARDVDKYLKSDGSYRSVLAISNESDSHRRLSRFRDKREGDILITVAMAHEGFDVPDCTHLVALTQIRARAWLEQAFSRVTRFDREAQMSWEEQCAYLYAPSDHSMMSFLAEWIDEQDARFGEPPAPVTAANQPRGATTFSPISGQMTGTMYADTFGILSEPDQKRIVLVDRKYPFLGHHPVVERLKVARGEWPKDDCLPGLAEVSPV